MGTLQYIQILGPIPDTSESEAPVSGICISTKILTISDSLKFLIYMRTGNSDEKIEISVVSSESFALIALMIYQPDYLTNS